MLARVGLLVILSIRMACRCVKKQEAIATIMKNVFQILSVLLNTSAASLIEFIKVEITREGVAVVCKWNADDGADVIFFIEFLENCTECSEGR